MYTRLLNLFTFRQSVCINDTKPLEIVDLKEQMKNWLWLKCSEAPPCNGIKLVGPVLWPPNVILLISHNLWTALQPVLQALYFEIMYSTVQCTYVLQYSVQST